MEITFLGTGSMIPTKNRNQTAMFLKYKDEGILFDCGEGTQRQFKVIGIAPTKVTKILVSHWHSDHILGLPGLITTLGASKYNKKLEIYGPKDSKKFVQNIFKAFIPKNRINLEVIEVKKQKIFENHDFYIEALPMKHGAPCLGYSVVEKGKRKIDLTYLKKFKLKQHPILKKLQQGKDITWKGKKIKASKATKEIQGKKVTFITDTIPNDNIIKLAKESDVFICESTHTKEVGEKTSKYKHMTAEQAAQLAKKAKVKKLIITHYSQRYKTSKPLLEEAKKVFKNTIAAEDFKKVNV